MSGLTREGAHVVINEVFNALEELSSPMRLEQIMLKAQTDAAVTGCVLVARQGHLPDRPYVTWGISPYETGLHSGHYDLDRQAAEVDWLMRVARGW